VTPSSLVEVCRRFSSAC